MHRLFERRRDEGLHTLKFLTLKERCAFGGVGRVCRELSEEVTKLTHSLDFVSLGVVVTGRLGYFSPRVRAAQIGLLNVVRSNLLPRLRSVSLIGKNPAHIHALFEHCPRLSEITLDIRGTSVCEHPSSPQILLPPLPPTPPSPFSCPLPPQCHPFLLCSTCVKM